jgi:hypothetical protein
MLLRRLRSIRLSKPVTKTPHLAQTSARNRILFTARAHAMPPFTPKEVTRYLLWIGLIVLAVVVLAWYLLYQPAHEPLQPKRSGATALVEMLHAGQSISQPARQERA